MTRQRSSVRPGFTLIELIIVITIMAVIAGLAVAFIPNLDRNKGVPNAVTQLEGWLRLSKNQAMRDGSPRGVRLIFDPNDTTRVTALQYIEQPEPVSPRGPNLRAFISTPNPNGMMMPPLPPPFPNPMQTTVSLALVDAMGNPAAPVQWSDHGVQAGDFFELTVAPFGMYQIASVAGNQVTLMPGKSVEGTDTGSPLILSEGFTIIRAPRPLVGEPLMELNKDVYIEVATSVVPLGLSNQPDILFNSSGQVAGAPMGQIYLVVVHGDRPTDRLIVVVYTRTGKINGVLWNDGGADPYGFARDGSGSGL